MMCVLAQHSPLGHVLQPESTRDVLIVGLEDRNRAVHGDVVVVQLYPEAQWRSRDRSIATSTEAEANTDGPRMPTGFVWPRRYVERSDDVMYVTGRRYSAATLARLCGVHQ